VYCFQVSPEAAKERGGFGDERYETPEFQEKVCYVVNSHSSFPGNANLMKEGSLKALVVVFQINLQFPTIWF